MAKTPNGTDYHQFEIQINYKSGISMTMWVYKFESSDGNYSWNVVNHLSVKPVLLGVDNIESVWTLNTHIGVDGERPDTSS